MEATPPPPTDHLSHRLHLFTNELFTNDDDPHAWYRRWEVSFVWKIDTASAKGSHIRRHIHRQRIEEIRRYQQVFDPGHHYLVVKVKLLDEMSFKYIRLECFATNDFDRRDPGEEDSLANGDDLFRTYYRIPKRRKSPSLCYMILYGWPLRGLIEKFEFLEFEHRPTFLDLTILSKVALGEYGEYRSFSHHSFWYSKIILEVFSRNVPGDRVIEPGTTGLKYDWELDIASGKRKKKIKPLDFLPQMVDKAQMKFKEERKKKLALFDRLEAEYQTVRRWIKIEKPNMQHEAAMRQWRAEVYTTRQQIAENLRRNMHEEKMRAMDRRLETMIKEIEETLKAKERTAETEEGFTKLEEIKSRVRVLVESPS
ncbi:hypothetical protein D9615_002021 [Tricholomella constricta]|uniref:Uncharacterized protein n=1 Tax=Tricholomella constricta TaxID=117010 RepID=A0A8H5MAN0_9AGAR|nr:hypothetical protein D9615_002021 [Tricholomella constricta]